MLLLLEQLLLLPLLSLPLKLLLLLPEVLLLLRGLMQLLLQRAPLLHVLRTHKSQLLLRIAVQTGGRHWQAGLRLYPGRRGGFGTRRSRH